MKRSLKSALKVSALSVCAIAPIALSAGMVSAQPTGMTGHYVGAGLAAGVTNGGQQADAANLGGNIQGRIDIPNAPVSVRGAILWNDETTAIMPIATFDVPITNRANVYVGAGYSFVEENGKPTPLGNQDSFVVTAGAEAGVSKDIVVYGDAKLGTDAYQNSSASAVSLQAGVGVRF